MVHDLTRGVQDESFLWEVAPIFAFISTAIGYKRRLFFIIESLKNLGPGLAYLGVCAPSFPASP